MTTFQITFILEKHVVFSNQLQKNIFDWYCRLNIFEKNMWISFPYSHNLCWSSKSHTTNNNSMKVEAKNKIFFNLLLFFVIFLNKQINLFLSKYDEQHPTTLSYILHNFLFSYFFILMLWVQKWRWTDGHIKFIHMYIK